ncbi:codanin-1 [Aricia agestis]|uniref:codanin-1 n=1 Tax=Aricia agestis TaxID=91739 RepID=UPI001C2069E1|nr:codanin-1 [Aricia agestis]
MPDTIIECVLSGKIDSKLMIQWLNGHSIEGTSEDSILQCYNRNEFVAYFLSFLRNHTDSILQTNSNVVPIPQHQCTPEKSIGRIHHRSISDPTYENDRSIEHSHANKNDKKIQESPYHDKKKTGRKVKTKLFHEEKSINQSHSSDESRISVGLERIALTSTPMKNGLKSEYPSFSSPVTPQSRSFKDVERCDTPRLSRNPRSHDKSISLGDYFVNVQPKSSNKKKRQSRNSSNGDETKSELDCSNSEMFPEIGARKSSSLRSECRRIKPTSIDKSKKSLSLNSFTQETFQQSPLAMEENSVFKPKVFESTTNFEAERNILREERHKLMEKFNILNTSLSPKTVTVPQIKILQRDKVEKNIVYIDADSTKVVFKDKLDMLIQIYDILLRNNLILSINTEIYFLITILLSKQIEDDYNLFEKNVESNIYNFILRSIHNCTYFAVKSLWHLRTTLEVILDKNSLKILGENKKVRGFFPELAKFLLNSYGLKCEAEANSEKTKTGSERFSNGIVCFNFETDNADNFPSLLSFQNFKKQRDMFYEILRWYQDTQSTGVPRSTFRARIKALLTCGQTAANHAHLAALFTQMLANCIPPNEQESKMSKLQRRLTCPAAPESHRLPYFNDKEIFYKEFIMYAENESFRVHLRDALASEIIILDNTPIGGDTSNSADVGKEFLQLSKKLGLFSKFLGYLTALPYCQVSPDLALKTGTLNMGSQKEDNFIAPKDKVLENNIALRNYSQPYINIKGMLLSAYENGRLCVTIPWIVHYLSMLDFTSLRIHYYKEILQILFHIYANKLKINNKRIMIVYLKSILGWLFDLPHVPQELFYQKFIFNVNETSDVLDSSDFIDETMLLELCPCLKDLNVLLTTSKVGGDQKDSGSFRHITPVSLNLNTEERMKNKERELQLRLEEEFIKSQPSSTRRVLELVIERVTSAAVKELTAVVLPDARVRARNNALALINNTKDKTNLVQALETMYLEFLEQLRTESLEKYTSTMKGRVDGALSALVGSGGGALSAAAVRACRTRLTAWLKHHWRSSSVLCKNVHTELIMLLEVGEGVTGQTAESIAALSTDEFHTFCSPAETIISLKEQICLLLEYADIPEPSVLLEACANCCAARNVFTRPPAQRVLLQLSIDFCLVFLSRKPSEVNEGFLNKLHVVWNTCCPERKRREEPEPERDFGVDDRAPTPVSDDEQRLQDVKPPDTPIAKSEGESSELLEYFDRILCPRNIVLLSETKCKDTDVWDAVSVLMVFLLKHNYLSEDSLTEQCLAVYRQDWPQNILKNLSTCMKTVSSKWSRASTGKFTLFLDFLADYCGDMDYEIVD